MPPPCAVYFGSMSVPITFSEAPGDDWMVSNAGFAIVEAAIQGMDVSQHLVERLTMARAVGGMVLADEPSEVAEALCCLFVDVAEAGVVSADMQVRLEELALLARRYLAAADRRL